jgi:hypothetical protein
MENKILGSNKQEVTIKPTKWTKIQRVVFITAGLMISAGQWADTKELVTSAYSGFVENFTHTLQYELIDELNVGNSMAFVIATVGEPNVIKRSSVDRTVQYYYYNKEKFTLTLITSDERLNGYSILTRIDDFIPQVPFAEDLGSKAIVETNNSEFSYSFDTGNLIYYIESQNLGKDKMYLSLTRGYIEYAAQPITTSEMPSYRNNVHASLESLMQQETFAGDEDNTTEAVNNVRTLVMPNYYAIADTDSKIVAESLLTRFEYAMLTKR